MQILRKSLLYTYYMDECDRNQYFKCKYYVNDSEWPILPASQLFQSFPIKVVQNDSEWSIPPISPNFTCFATFQSFPTDVVQNDSD